MSEFVTVEIDLPKDLHIVLCKIADDEENTTVEELIVEILKEYCACRYTINVNVAGDEYMCDEAVSKIQQFAEGLRELYKEDLTIGTNVEAIDADEA